MPLLAYVLSAPSVIMTFSQPSFFFIFFYYLSLFLSFSRCHFSRKREWKGTRTIKPLSLSILVQTAFLSFAANPIHPQYYVDSPFPGRVRHVLYCIVNPLNVSVYRDTFIDIQNCPGTLHKQGLRSQRVSTGIA